LASQRIGDTIRAVFFDAVGTLLHPSVSVAETYRIIAARHGTAIEPALIRQRIREAFIRQEKIDHQAGWRTSEIRERERWQTIVRETLLELTDPAVCFNELWECYRQPGAWRLPEDANPVLRALSQRGTVVGMASNFDARLLEVAGQIPDLAGLKDRCVVSSLVGWRKPAGDFFQEVIRVAGCPAENILFVGDDLRNDYQGARAAGMNALLIDPEGKSDVPDRIAKLSDILE